MLVACMYRRAGLKLDARRDCAWQQKDVGSESLIEVYPREERRVVVVVDV